MPSKLTPSDLEIIEEAYSILKQESPFFDNLITKYEIKPFSPAWDLACFLTYSHFSHIKSLEFTWNEFWEKRSKNRVYRNLHYRVPYSYIPLIADNNFNKLVYKLLELNRLDIYVLDWNVFFSIFFDYCSKTLPTLSKREFSLFLAALQCQSLKSNDLLKHLEIDSSNLSKYKRRLMEKGIVYQGISLNYPRLNLAVYGVYLESSKSLSEAILKEIPNSPFLHSIFQSYLGNNKLLIQYVAPSIPEVSRDLLRLVQNLESKFQIADSLILSFKNATRLTSFNYSIYDIQSKEWNLESYDIRMHFSFYDQIRDKQAFFVKQLQTNNFDYKIKLNKEGIEILNHILYNNHLTIKQIATNLKYSERTVKNHIKNLEDSSIYSLRINPSYIFSLTNIVLFLRNSDDKQMEYHNKFSILPEVYSEQFLADNKTGYYFVLRVPPNLVLEAIDILEEDFSENILKVFVVNQMYSKRWSIPMDKYETLFQEWKYNPEDVLGDTVGQI